MLPRGASDFLSRAWYSENQAVAHLAGVMAVLTGIVVTVVLFVTGGVRDSVGHVQTNVQDLRGEVQTDVQELREEVQADTRELRKDINEVKRDVQDDISEVKRDVAALGSDISFIRGKLETASSEPEEAAGERMKVASTEQP